MGIGISHGLPHLNSLKLLWVLFPRRRCRVFSESVGGFFCLIVVDGQNGMSRQFVQIQKLARLVFVDSRPNAFVRVKVSLNRELVFDSMKFQ